MLFFSFEIILFDTQVFDTITIFRYIVSIFDISLLTIYRNIDTIMILILFISKVRYIETFDTITIWNSFISIFRYNTRYNFFDTIYRIAHPLTLPLTHFTHISFKIYIQVGPLFHYFFFIFLKTCAAKK